MKLLVYLEQAKILNIMRDKKQANPGVGGTTFTAARLAIALKDEINKNGYNIEIFFTTEIKDYTFFHDIKVIPLSQISKFQFGCAIITGDLINSIFEKKIFINSQRFISCIRHPYDYDKISKSRKIKAEILSVSNSAYISNYFICGPHNQIDNLFNAERIRKSLSVDKNSVKTLLIEKENKKLIRIGFMGALVASKGFHLLAKNWSKVSNYCNQKNIDVRLDVIGGSDLYEFKNSHKILPCSKKYGDLLVNYLREEINKTVFFHGTLGPERYDLMSNCDIAVVNPTGSGETFCATILEWFSLGVPVISSLNYGLSDYMKYFKDLTINNPNEIQKKIISYINFDTNQKNSLKLKSYLIANYHSANEEQIIQKWLLLINESNIFVKELTNIKIYFGAIKNYIKFILFTIKKILYKFLFF